MRSAGPHYGWPASDLLSARKKLSAGDDSEICTWNLLPKTDLWHVPVSRFEHFIESRRLSLPYLKAMQQGVAQTQTVFSGFKILIDCLNMTKRRQRFGSFLIAMADLKLSMAKGEHVS